LERGFIHFSRKHHRLQVSELREACRTQTQRSSVQTTNDRMGDKPPSQLNSWVKLHVPRPTHVFHEAACAPSTCVPFCTCSPFQELKIKTYISHSFCNNNKLLFLRTQAPKIIPTLPTFQNLFPLPSLWKISPPSPFLHGRSTCNDI